MQSHTMNPREIEQQVLVEQQTLSYVASALRTTIDWKFQGPDFTRKLSSLRFVGESFERHLNRLIELKEEDGYMLGVVAECPQFADGVKALHQEHGKFRAEVRDLLRRLHEVSSTDRETLTAISDDLAALLTELEEHQQKEMDLLQEALLRDEGGEG